MINRAERIAEELKEKARRYEYLTDLLDKAHDVEMLWDELVGEFGDKCGWVSEQASKLTQEIESEMAEIEGALE
tara:strand:- start:305 stop:526 length:222 start_codon:yes stop_codon:yes gene_type:complete